MSFFGTLLRARDVDKQWFITKQIPQEVFASTPSIANWVYSYIAQHRRVPTVQAAKDRFPNADFANDVGETVETSLQRVLDAHQFQTMKKIVSDVGKKIDNGAPISEAVALLRDKTSTLTSFTTDCTDIDSQSDAAYIRYLQRRSSYKLAPYRLTPSPWPNYNDIVKVTEPGEFNIIAARTSIGKSWIALYWAAYLARLGAKVLFVSKEMPAAQINDRLESIRFKIPYTLLRSGELTPHLMGKWRARRRDWKLRGSLVVSATESLKGSDLAHICQKIEETKADFVFVDGAYLLYPQGVRFSDDVARYRYIADNFKRYAKVYNTAIFGVIQSNRDSETSTGDTKPTLSTIYGSDAWAQAADIVVLIGGMREAGTRQIYIAKGRESGLGNFQIRFMLDYPDFSATSIIQSSSTHNFVAAT